MNKKEFCKDLAALINRYGIDADFETADDILADVAIDALNAYFTAKKKQEMRDNPELDNCDCPACQLRRTMAEAKEKSERREPGEKEYRKPEAFDLPKEVADVAEFFRDMFPGAEISVGRIEIPRRNPRDKRRAKNKRKGGRNNETR